MIRSVPWEEMQEIAKLFPYYLTEGSRGITNGSAYFLLDRWTHNSFQMHMYIREAGKMTPDLAREVFRYGFIECGKGVAIGITPAHNTRALRFAQGMGFELKHAIKDGGAIGDDLIISELRKENCKFLRKFHEPRRSSTT